MKRIEFRLSMPGRASWDGGWSGEGRNYAIVRTLTDGDAAKLMNNTAEKGWFHRWPDGWTAQITARVVPSGERLKKSAGFCCYDWMVSNILDHGNTRTKDAMKRADDSGKLVEVPEGSK